MCCNGADALVQAIHLLDRRRVKGLGPAVANLLYFLHPTWMPPFNTAIVRGYNAVTHARVKLGKWGDYLAMRDGILRLNADYRDQLSNDLGAIGGLLFDIGSGRYPAPPAGDDEAQRAIWQADLDRARRESTAAPNGTRGSKAICRTLKSRAASVTSGTRSGSMCGSPPTTGRDRFMPGGSETVACQSCPLSSVTGPARTRCG